MNKVIDHGILNKRKVIIIEQDCVLSNKSKVEGFKKYIRISGLKYTLTQIVKQYLFLLLRFIAKIKHNEDSIYFPYFLNKGYITNDFSRKQLNNLKSSQLYNYIKKFNPDLVFAVYSKEIIPENIISIPKYGCVNLHPALLPFYRGISPQFWCLANGEEKTGVTLYYIDKGIDTGPIIKQKIIPTKPHKTEHSLYRECSEIGSELIIEFLTELTENPNTKIETINNPKEGSYYSLPSKDAVKKFIKKGYRFFTVKELFKELKCKKHYKKE